MNFSESNLPLSCHICSKHFSPSSLDGKGKIQPDAVPSNIGVHLPDYQGGRKSHFEKDFTPKTKHLSVFEEQYGAFVCRICSYEFSLGDEMINIFEDNRNVLEKIKSCFALMTDDGIDNYDLPGHICTKCFHQLEMMYKIRSLAIVSDSLFNHYLKSIGYSEKSYEEFCVENQGGTEEVERSTANYKDSSFLKQQGLGSNLLPLKGPVTCNLCDKEFSDMDQFDSHMDEHGAPFIWQNVPEGLKTSTVCSACGLIFDDECFYKEHKKKKKHECNTCDVVLFSYCEFKRHECKSLTNWSKAPVCKTETEAVKKAGRIEIMKLKTISLKLDEKSDNGVVYKCKNCSEVFEDLQKLLQHKEARHKKTSTHGGRSGAWVCKYCGKQTTTKLSLHIHERIHTGVKPFICEWCGNTFRSKANLSQHHTKHTGVRKHSCQVCGKLFSRRSFVTTHMRVHTGERPYECDICLQKFTQVGDMRRHRQRHTMTTSQISQLHLQHQPLHIQYKPDNSSITVSTAPINSTNTALSTNQRKANFLD